MTNFEQAMNQANQVLKDSAVVSVEVEFVTAAGHVMTATIGRSGLIKAALK